MMYRLIMEEVRSMFEAGAGPVHLCGFDHDGGILRLFVTPDDWQTSVSAT